MRRAAVVVAAVVLVAAAAVACGRLGTADTSVAFTAPVSGATLVSPVRVEMRANGFTIEPTGRIRERAGHFHVMVDVGCFRPGAFVEMHTVGFEHVGSGASSVDLDLAPGKHTLCLQIANGAHVTLAPTDEITVTVLRR